MLLQLCEYVCLAAVLCPKDNAAPPCSWLSDYWGRGRVKSVCVCVCVKIFSLFSPCIQCCFYYIYIYSLYVSMELPHEDYRRPRTFQLESTHVDKNISNRNVSKLNELHPSALSCLSCQLLNNFLVFSREKHVYIHAYIHSHPFRLYTQGNSHVQ